jgi:hypothetical protein
MELLSRGGAAGQADLALGRSNYAPVAGVLGHVGASITLPAGTLPNPGAPAQVDALAGILVNRSIRKTGEVLDGLSNTLLFGECVYGSTDGVTRPFTAAWMGVMGLSFQYLPLRNRMEWFNFSSQHPGIVQFAQADGSVRPVRITISDAVLLRMGGHKDGLTFTAP